MEKLTNEELVKLYHNDKSDAVFNELYIRNKGLIHDVMNKYTHNILIDEIVINSACHLGFIQAVNTYKVDSDCKFSSYCYRVMTNEVNKSIKYAGRKMRNHLDQSFVYLDDVAIKGDGSHVIDVIDLSHADTLVSEDYTYLYNAIDYAKSKIVDKYHPYLIPILLRETSTYKVAEQIGMSRKTVQYTVTRFRKFAREHIEKHLNEGMK